MVMLVSFTELSDRAMAGTIVVVQLQNGRRMMGEVDSRTDEFELWLHSTEPSIAISSSVPWPQIAVARIAGGPDLRTDLRSRLRKLRSPIPVTTFQQVATRMESLRSPQLQRVVSLEIVPRLTNWDDDVEPDGFEVRVSPFTSEGTAAAVNGNITLRLLGRRLGTYERLESHAGFGLMSNGSNTREYSPRLNTTVYFELGRWNERLSAKNRTPSGYQLRLPFRDAHPEFDLDIALDGQLDARLSVDGQRIHETTLPVQLRAFSGLREELQLNRRMRYLPVE